MTSSSVQRHWRSLVRNRIRLRNFSPGYGFTTQHHATYVIKADFSDSSIVGGGTPSPTAVQNIEQAELKLGSVCKTGYSSNRNSSLTVGQLGEQLKWGIRPSTVNGSSSSTEMTVEQLVEQLRIGIKRLREADEMKARATAANSQSLQKQRPRSERVIKSNNTVNRTTFPIKSVKAQENIEPIREGTETTHESPQLVAAAGTVEVYKAESVVISDANIVSSTKMGMNPTHEAKKNNKATSSHSSVKIENPAVATINPSMQKKLKPVTKVHNVKDSSSSPTAAQLIGLLKEKLKVLLGQSDTRDENATTISQLIDQLEQLSKPTTKSTNASTSTIVSQPMSKIIDVKDSSALSEGTEPINIETKVQKTIKKSGNVISRINSTTSIITLKLQQNVKSINSVNVTVGDSSRTTVATAAPVMKNELKELKKRKVLAEGPIVEDNHRKELLQPELRKCIDNIFPNRGDCDVELFKSFIAKEFNECNSSSIAYFMRNAGNKSRIGKSTILLRENLPVIATRLQALSDTTWHMIHIQYVLFGLQYYAEDDIGYINILDIMYKISNETLQHDDEIPFSVIPNILFGLRKNEYKSVESLKLLTTITRIIKTVSGSMTAIELGNTLINFHYLDSDRSEVRELLSVLTEKIKKLNQTVESRDLSNSLTGLRCMKSDNLEVRALLTVLTDNIKNGSRGLHSNSIGFSLYGLQKMNSDILEVRALLSVLIPKIQLCDSIFKAKAFSNVLYGLQGFKSDCIDVRNLLPVLALKIDNCSDILTAQQICDALYGFQGMKSDCVEVHTLLSVVVSRVQSCTEIPNSQQISHAMIGLQGLDKNHIDVVTIKRFLGQ